MIQDFREDFKSQLYMKMEDRLYSHFGAISCKFINLFSSKSRAIPFYETNRKRKEFLNQ